MNSCRPTRSVCKLILLLLMFCIADAGLAKKKPPLHPVNLNAASAMELQQVPGIGPSTADKILQMRKSYGSFKSVNDLLAIKGLGPKRLDKMRKYLTVGKTVQNKKPADGAQAAKVQGKSSGGKSATAKDAAVAKEPAKPAASEDEEP